MDMMTYVYVKQRKNLQEDQTLYFDTDKHFLCPDHVARQVVETERKLQTSPYDSERKGRNWVKFVAFHKKKHAIV